MASEARAGRGEDGKAELRKLMGIAFHNERSKMRVMMRVMTRGSRAAQLLERHCSTDRTSKTGGKKQGSHLVGYERIDCELQTRQV